MTQSMIQSNAYVYIYYTKSSRINLIKATRAIGIWLLQQKNCMWSMLLVTPSGGKLIFHYPQPLFLVEVARERLQ